MKEKIITFLLFSTIFVNSITLFEVPFEGYSYYLVVLLFLPFFIFKFGFPKMVIWLLMYPIMVGLINLLFGNVEAFSFIKVTGGMIFLLPFYFYFVKYFDENIELLFSIYLKWCYVVAFVGVIQSLSFVIGFEPGYDYRWLLDKSAMSPGSFGLIRVNSFLLEPSAIARTLAPAYFIALRNLIGKNDGLFEMSKTTSVLILAVSILSFSSLAYIGIFIAIVFIFIERGRIQYLIIGSVLLFSLVLVTYNFVKEVRFRADAFYGLLVLEDYKTDNVNTSSFVLWNHATIAWNNMLDHPFGTGLGSHNIAFERYSLTRHMQIIQRENNFFDANSTFLRVMSELGIPGVIFLLFILKRYYVPLTRSDKYSVISNGLLVLILLQLFRQGNYFIGGFPLIILMYYYNGKQYIDHLNEDYEVVSEDEKISILNN